MTEFAGLTKEAFDTYSPEKWASNVHNLKRMRIKADMLALCDRAQQGLVEQLQGLNRAASDEIPNFVNQKKVDAQWVYWFRDAKSREALSSFLEKIILNQASIFNVAPQDKHLTLTVVLRQEGIWVGLRMATLATVDRRNLAVKLSRTWERERFLELLQAVPEGGVMELEGDKQPVSSLNLESLEECGRQVGTHDAPWTLGELLTPEQCITMGKDLGEHLHRWMTALVPLYRFIAWTRDNDCIEASKQLNEEKQQKRRNTTSFSPGDRVRITAGLFSGKNGTVQETDTKAQVKVMVGSMSVVVSSNDIQLERRA